MRLDIFADIICPWCWIGKRRLERALKARPQQGLTTRWRAFQLNPGMPATGMDRREYLAAKFGNDSQAKRIYDVIRAAGESEGLEFNFDKIQQTPNTLRAHRLVRLAQERGKGSQMVEAKAVAEGNFERIRDLARQYVAVVRQTRDEANKLTTESQRTQRG